MIYIIEGVAGSGKDTLSAQLVDALKPDERRVLVFDEEAVLASWLHYFVPGIHELRLELADRLIDYAEELLAREPDASFVFNRFHVSYAVWRWEYGVDLELRHERLIERLRHFDTRVIHTLLRAEDADQRSSHLERQQMAWRRFLEDRISFHGQDSAGQSYLEQQDAMTRVLKHDGLPYRQVEVSADTPFDTSLLQARADRGS